MSHAILEAIPLILTSRAASALGIDCTRTGPGHTDTITAETGGAERRRRRVTVRGDRRAGMRCGAVALSHGKEAHDLDANSSPGPVIGRLPVEVNRNLHRQVCRCGAGAGDW